MLSSHPFIVPVGPLLILIRLHVSRQHTWRPVNLRIHVTRPISLPIIVTTTTQSMLMMLPVPMIPTFLMILTITIIPPIPILLIELLIILPFIIRVGLHANHRGLVGFFRDGLDLGGVQVVAGLVLQVAVLLLSVVVLLVGGDGWG